MSTSSSSSWLFLAASSLLPISSCSLSSSRPSSPSSSSSPCSTSSCYFNSSSSSPSPSPISSSYYSSSSCSSFLSLSLSSSSLFEKTPIFYLFVVINISRSFISSKSTHHHHWCHCFKALIHSSFSNHISSVFPTWPHAQGGLPMKLGYVQAPSCFDKEKQEGEYRNRFHF